MSKIRNKILIRLSLVALSFVLMVMVATNLKANDFENEITEKELDIEIQSESKTIVYFYKEDCPYCIKANEKIFKTAEKNKINLKTYDMENTNYSKYKLNIVPTIIHFKDGYEINRIEGNKARKEFDNFFKEVKRN